MDKKGPRKEDNQLGIFVSPGSALSRAAVAVAALPGQPDLPNQAAQENEDFPKFEESDSESTPEAENPLQLIQRGT